MERLWIGLAGLFGAGAVAMAAYAAHAVPPGGEALRAVQAGVQMQGWHALALLGTGLWARRGRAPAHGAGAAFALGLPLFCAAVYAPALGGPHLGAAAPVGGGLLIAGWLLLAASALMAR